MDEYWEITHDRAVKTQAVWAMQPTFALNKLNRTQHGALSDSLPVLAQLRDNKENDLTEALAAKHTVFDKLANVAVRVPGLLQAMLDEEDELQDQLDPIFAIDAGISENHTLRRCRLVLPFWTDVNAARATAAPPQAAVTIDYQGTAVGVGEFASLISSAIGTQKTEADRSRDVTNAKSALRTADRKTDRGNKRFYKGWLKAYPAGTPEGDAALSQIPTEQGTPPPTALEIATLTPLPDHTVRVNFAAGGGAHATTKELQYQLPGETEFGHTTPITGAQMIVGPLSAGATVNFRTRVANSTPGTVTSAVKTVVVA